MKKNLTQVMNFILDRKTIGAELGENEKNSKLGKLFNSSLSDALWFESNHSLNQRFVRGIFIATSNLMLA